MIIHYTQHINHLSPYECDDSCGTCDGANYSDCKVYYPVKDINDTFFTEEAAEEAEAELDRLIPIDRKYYYDRLFFIEHIMPYMQQSS